MLTMRDRSNPFNRFNPLDPFSKLLMSAPARCSETHTAAYQISGTNSRGRTISSPALHPNAFANASEFESGPFTRHLSGECGSVVTRVMSDSSLSCRESSARTQ